METIRDEQNKEKLKQEDLQMAVSKACLRGVSPVPVNKHNQKPPAS